MRPSAQVALAAALGALAQRGTAAALGARPPGGALRWDRTNYAGSPVTLLGGAAVAGACVLAPALGALPRGGTPGRAAVGAAVAAAAGGALGALDDLREDAESRSKGLRGHLGALARGKVTTGSLKILGIGAGAALGAVLLTPRSGTRAATVTQTVAGAALVAGTANLHNLLDLRPGRALKAATAISAALALAGGPQARTSATLAAGALGVACAALPQDLAERTMLGDTGANALGALVGSALAAHPARAVRASALGTVVALTLLSERVSFSRVIVATPVLRELDAWGRR